MSKHDITETGSAVTMTDGDTTIRVTTEHAWPEPRGEVYVSMSEAIAWGDDYEVLDTHESMLGLTPDEAERLGHALLALAKGARTMPVATVDTFGRSLATV